MCASKLWKKKKKKPIPAGSVWTPQAGCSFRGGGQKDNFIYELFNKQTLVSLSILGTDIPFSLMFLLKAGMMFSLNFITFWHDLLAWPTGWSSVSAELPDFRLYLSTLQSQRRSKWKWYLLSVTHNFHVAAHLCCSTCKKTRLKQNWSQVITSPVKHPLRNTSMSLCFYNMELCADVGCRFCFLSVKTSVALGCTAACSVGFWGRLYLGCPRWKSLEVCRAWEDPNRKVI